jgi:hypothetical protein
LARETEQLNQEIRRAARRGVISAPDQPGEQPERERAPDFGAGARTTPVPEADLNDQIRAAWRGWLVRRVGVK